jgi:uncharacterized protein (DUF934 family)
MLVKGGRVIDDGFVTVADGEALPQAPVIVSLKRFLAEKSTLLARPFPLGVQLESADSPEALDEDIHKLGVIVLHVAHFRDGRAYSWARLIRTRLRYTGELRASGHILKDQLAFFVRVGVDAFELAQNLSLTDIETALHEISNVYQPSVDGRTTILKLRAAQARGNPQAS